MVSYGDKEKIYGTQMVRVGGKNEPEEDATAGCLLPV